MSQKILTFHYFSNIHTDLISNFSHTLYIRRVYTGRVYLIEPEVNCHYRARTRPRMAEGAKKRRYDAQSIVRREERRKGGREASEGLISAIDFREIIRRDSSPRVNTDASLRSRTFIRYIDRLIYRPQSRSRSFVSFSPTNHPPRTLPGREIGGKSAPPNRDVGISTRQRRVSVRAILLFPSPPIIDAPRSPSCEKFRGKNIRRVRSQTNEKKIKKTNTNNPRELNYFRWLARSDPVPRLTFR